MVKIISFDGLHRSGKGTQIEKIKLILVNKGYKVLVIRGDGSRLDKDYPNEFNFSSFWSRWQNLRNIFSKKNQFWDLAYKKLNKDNKNVLSYVINEEQKPDSKYFILMDRSFISRIFVLLQNKRDSDFEKIRKEASITPSLYFILDVAEEILLERISKDKSEKSEFRKENVSKHFNSWTQTVEIAKQKLGSSLIRINANQNEEIITNIILSELKKRDLI